MTPSIARITNSSPNLVTGLVLAVLLGPMLHPFLTFAGMAVLYLLAIRKRVAEGIATNPLYVKLIAVYVLCFAVFAAYQMLANGIKVSQLNEFYNFFLSPLIFVLMLDAMGIHARDIDLKKIALWLPPLILAAFIIKTIYYLGISRFSPNIEIWRLFIGPANTNNFLKINPNHQDDVFVFFLALLAWCAIVLGLRRNFNLVSWLAGAVLVVALTYLFIRTNSLGAFIGVVAGVAVAVVIWLLITGHKKIILIAGAALLTVVAAIGISQADRLADFTNPGETFKRFDGEQICDAFYVNERRALRVKPEIGVGPSELQRIIAYTDGIRIWFQKPVMGHGIFSRNELTEQYDFIRSCNFEYTNHIHSLYLEILIKGGVVLLVFFFVAHSIVPISLYQGLHRGMKATVVEMVPFLPIIAFIIYELTENVVDRSFESNDLVFSVTLAMWTFVAVVINVQQSNPPIATNAA